MTINTILFDFGGVIYKTPNLQWINRWKNLLGLADDPEIVAMLANPNESPLINDICLGKIPEDQIWITMGEKWHIKPAIIKRFRRRMMSKRSLNKPLLKFLESLHEIYQTGILSNAGDQSRELMVDKFNLDHYTDEIIISAEEGVIKPDPKIYQIAIDRFGAKPEEVLFLDDYLVNVEAARDFGLTAVHFINNSQTIQTIRHILESGT
jgi:putative hydrolase of the HAD superfamily